MRSRKAAAVADRVVAAEALAAGVTTLTPSYLDDPRYEPLVASIVDRLQSEAATWDHEFPDGNTGEIMGVDDAARVVARWLVRAALIGRTDLDLTAAIEAGQLAGVNAGCRCAMAMTVCLDCASEAAVRAAAPVIERAVRERDGKIPPREVMDALLDAVRDFREAIAEPLAPDHEVQTWPLCAPEQEFGGGVWCADEDCPLMAENSEIGDFRECDFTLAQLHEAIAGHIAARREREAPDA